MILRYLWSNVSHILLYKLISDCFPLANGSITSDPTVRSKAEMYTANPPSFQLVGDSTGGPPTTNYWTRNGINITNNSTFSTSISFTGPFNDDGYRAANYQSILTVTGRQPGVYQYHVSNKRTTGTRTSKNITIEEGNYCNYNGWYKV